MPLYQKLPSKTNKACDTLQEKQERNLLRDSPMDPFTWTYQFGTNMKNIRTKDLHGHRVRTRRPAGNDG